MIDHDRLSRPVRGVMGVIMLVAMTMTMVVAVTVGMIVMMIVVVVIVTLDMDFIRTASAYLAHYSTSRSLILSS